jgi:hypothetical protein
MIGRCHTEDRSFVGMLSWRPTEREPPGLTPRGNGDPAKYKARWHCSAPFRNGIVRCRKMSGSNPYRNLSGCQYDFTDCKTRSVITLNDFPIRVFSDHFAHSESVEVAAPNLHLIAISASAGKTPFRNAG